MGHCQSRKTFFIKNVFKLFSFRNSNIELRLMEDEDMSEVIKRIFLVK